jgi:2-succinyl-6-hydroxy-2,4-cyclohexadiene-1-carboxylate synthase
MDAEALVATLGKERLWIAPDLPGHGGTIGLGDAAEYAAEAMTANVAALCRALPRPPILVAYSMGGRLGILVASKHPAALAGLILVGCGPGLEDEVERQGRADYDEALAARIEREGVEKFADFWESVPIIKTQRQIPAPWGERLRERRRKHLAAELACHLRAFGQGVAPRLPEEWKALRLPIWHVAGELDRAYRQKGETLLNGLPHAQVTLFPEAGHAAHLENLRCSRVKFCRIFEKIDEIGPLGSIFTQKTARM